MLHPLIELTLTPLASISIYLLILAIIGTLSSITGHVSRTYATLTPSAYVTVSTRVISAEQLAYTFRPQLFLKPGNNSPPALTMWWEAIDTGNSIALVYHPVWQDERHPIAVIHLLYRLCRAIVYGIPVRDIEYIQININRSDGSIQRIRFESSSASSYDSWFVKHTPVMIDRVGHEYIQTMSSANDPPQVTSLQLRHLPLRFGIVTWTHQFVLLTDNDVSQYAVPVTIPLGYLDEADYRQYKLARRSQGDFATKDRVGIVLIIIAAVASGLWLLFAFTTLIRSRSRYRKDDTF